MTFLCGFVSETSSEQRELVLASMVAALLEGGQAAKIWHTGRLSIAIVDTVDAGEPVPVNGVARSNPARTSWMAGEIYHSPFPDQPSLDSHPGELVDRLEADPDAIGRVDGEYQLAVWDSSAMALSIWNDRFGGLPLYTAVKDGSFYFAGGVRGILAVPGFEMVPDETAIREAVSFGGYRLGERTNVAGISMVPGGTQITWNSRTRSLAQRRYWSWADIPAREQTARSEGERLEEASALWKQAIARRLAGAKRPGQTLSGGLDSRVILAEASRRVASWTAITYGIPGCDDARYAEMAARAAGASWVFTPLYQQGWLDLRTRSIQATDGLIDLHDLGHLESTALQSRLFDVHLTGYIGDAVSGPTFTDIVDARGVLAKLPYYGGTLAMSAEKALLRAEELVSNLHGAPPRFALFEHKLPQSTNRWTVAWRPWMRVRKPFTDYELFDFYQSLDVRARREEDFYEKWLLAAYPEFLRTIPNQKTGVPIQSSWLRWQSVRGQRFLRRKARPHVQRFGLLERERIRGYTNDDIYLRTPEARQVIEATILRKESLTCTIFGREAVQAVLNTWFASAGVPAQVVGALYVFEAYHRDLQEFIRSRQAVAASTLVPFPRTSG